MWILHITESLLQNAVFLAAASFNYQYFSSLFCFMTSQYIQIVKMFRVNITTSFMKEIRMWPALSGKNYTIYVS